MQLSASKRTRASRRFSILALGFVMLFGTAQVVDAITITRTFVPSGGTFPGGVGTAGAASTNVAGGGSLTTIFDAAADCWEAAILDTFTVSLSYGWQSIGSLGVHNLVTQGGAPNRETAGVIRFDNSAGTAWFMDSTPMGFDEYSTFTESSANLGGGVMNTGRVLSGATGSASGRIDMFSVALHEIGHSLGLSSANTSFIAGNGDFDVDVTAPRPFAGASIPTVSGAHIDIGTALMFPSIGTSIRRIMTHADIVANGQISLFTTFNLNPCPVPEPGSIVALFAGASLLVWRKRRRS